MSGPATLEHLRQQVIAGARRVERGFTKPSDDWVQIAFIQTPDDLQTLLLSNELFRDGITKDVLGEVLRRYVVLAGAYRYALLLNVHWVKQDEMTDEQVEAVQSERMRLAQIEGAQEQLILLLGDAEEEQVWAAQIERRPGTAIRKLGAWERLDANEGWSFKGRFTGLNEYMRVPRKGGS